MSFRRGLTLVELMVALAVLGILAGVAVPYLLGNLPTYRVNGAARQVLGDLRLARTLAVEHGIQAFVAFDVAQRRYTVGLDTDEDESWDPARDETVKTVDLRELYPGIEFGSQGGDTVTFTSPDAVARFTADGTSQGGSVFLRPEGDTSGERDRAVVVSATTGRVRIE
ncbi:MAG: hypothetical protein Kow0092_36080 [Deferrisomatales bacterium]